MDNREKIDRIFEFTDTQDLMTWMRAHAYVDDKFALALLDKFWKPDSEDLKAVVEKCFMHSSYLKDKHYNWIEVEEDLTKMLSIIDKAIKDDEIVRGAYLAGYILILSLEAYDKDYYSRYDEHRKPFFDCVRKAEKIVREILIEGVSLDDNSKIGILSEITDGCKAFTDSPVFKVDWFLEEAYLVTMPMKSYISFINKLLRRKRDYRRDFHVRNKAKCLLKYDQWDKTREFLDKEIGNENVRKYYVDLLIEHGEYRKALEVADVDNSSIYIEEWITKQLDILTLIGDRQIAIDFCRRKFMTSYRRMEYFKRLKESVADSKWTGFVLGLLRDCDFKCDIDDAEVSIYIAEGMTDRIYPYIKQDGDYDIATNMSKYGMYLDESQQADLARQFADWVIERTQDLMSKPRKDFRCIAAWVESLAESTPVAREEAVVLLERLEEIYHGRPALMRELHSIDI